MAVAVLSFVAGPSSAESWARFSSDRTMYLVDLDTLTPTDGMAAVRLARVPATGDASDLSHEVEAVDVRCSDKQTRSGETVAYGPDGAEADRYSEETPWESTPATGVYGSIAAFVCDDLRPANSQAYPTVQAYIEAGRGG